MDDKISWVDWFLSQPKGKYFIKIDPEYMNNIYNFYGIRQKVPFFKYSLDLIRGDYILPEDRPSQWPPNLDEYGLCLYGILHARYLLTSQGQERMHEKYLINQFPKCPRFFCDGIQCLPYGDSDDIGQSCVRMFCPRCHQVYTISSEQNNSIDGSFFGPSWVHPFLVRYSHIVPKGPPKKYIPKIFGFKICPNGELPQFN